MGQPNFLVPVVLVAFLAAVAASFLLLEPRRAVLTTLLGGWLFVPHFSDRYALLIVHTKEAFVPTAVLLGSLVLDQRRWRGFRPALLDLPVAVLCLEPFVTAFQNDLGVREAVAAMLDTTMAWGAPYLLGRTYFGHPRALRHLAIALAVAALVYAPFCLFEIKMSPQLQPELYGFRSENYTTMFRFGGFRPSVFMQSGLAVAMFMALGTLSALWLWRTKAVSRLGGLAAPFACGALLVTTILCRSTGAIALLAVGAAVLEATRHLRTRILLLVLAAVPPVYCASRLAGWDAGQLVQLSARIVNPERAASVQFRIDNERLLIRRALMRPWLGWGRFGRSLQVATEEGSRRWAIVDSMWIIVFGVAGLVGLIALGALLLVPPLVFLRTFPPWYWPDPRLAPAAAMAMALLVWAIDDLLNAMMTPVFPAVAGALVALVLLARRARKGRGSGARPSRRVAVDLLSDPHRAATRGGG